MAAWTSHTLAINGTQMCVTVTGGDKPPLLLAHGYTDNGLYWTRIAQALEADYNVVMPDARGHGLTPGPDEPYTSELHADDLAGVIETLGLGKPPVMGHSMGADNTSLLAARHPDSVSSVILIDPPWHIAPGPPDAARNEHWQNWKADAIRRQQLSRDDSIAECRQQNPHWHPVDHETWADAKLQFDVRAFDLFQIMPRRWQEVAAEIQCPALLVMGDPERGGLVTPAIAQEAEKIAPNLRVVHIANAGHSIQRDQFEVFMAAVRAFLDEQS